MSPQVETRTRAPHKYLKDVLEVLPRGEENRLAGKELLQLLKERGVRLTIRQLQAAVLELRHHYGACVASLSGDGYFLATTKEEVQETLRYIASLIAKHRKTYAAIERSWFSQPSTGGRQLAITPALASVSQDFSDRDLGMTKEQALKAADYYWLRGFTFDVVVLYVELPKSRIEGLWDRLELPRRKRGGWGLKRSERHYEMCVFKIKTFFEQKDGIE